MKRSTAMSFGIALLLLPFAHPAQAGLKWDATTTQLQPKPGDAYIDAKFPFKNIGKESVWIISVDTSCACLSPSQAIGEYKPGQEGALNVRYKVGKRMGTLQETVTVHTSDRDNPTVALSMRVYVPLTYQIKPGIITWIPGSPAEPHEAYFYDLRGKGMKPVFVYSPSNNFTATLVPQPEKHRYAIRVVPASTETEQGTNIYIDVDLGDGKIQKVRIMAAVRPEGSTKPIHLGD